VCLVFIADCFVGGVPAVIGFIDLGFGSLAVSSGSSGHGGGIVSGCGLARGGVGASKGAAWGSNTNVAISQQGLGTEKEMKNKNGYAQGLLGPGQRFEPSVLLIAVLGSFPVAGVSGGELH